MELHRGASKGAIWRFIDDGGNGNCLAKDPNFRLRNSIDRQPCKDQVKPR